MTAIPNAESNQVDALADINQYDTDIALKQAVQHVSGDALHRALHDYGAITGSLHMRELADQANRHPPELTAWDAAGRRIDAVEYHPSWHALMAAGFSAGLHCSAWSGNAHAHVGRAARFMLHGQLESGTLCPLTMTSASIPLLDQEPVFASFVKKLRSTQYDAADMAWHTKQSVMVGMGLTEKQGGSDLRVCQTKAMPLGKVATPILGAGEQQHYTLTGHKWFFSAPTSDAHLVLAREEDGLSCFFVPRRLDDGSLNAIRIQRLKDKVGNRSNASAEVEFEQALALRLGERGRGIAMLMQMAAYTRLDCVLGSTALLRQAVAQACHFAGLRQAFGRTLVQHPLMRTVLADLALESEAATTLSIHLAHAFDQHDEVSQVWRRMLTPAAKFWICKRAVTAVAECMEVLGGNGYIENGPLARLYREAPVNAIWEGSGNVMCLDVLRAMKQDPQGTELLWASLHDSFATEPTMHSMLQRLKDSTSLDPADQEADARWFAGNLVMLVQAVLLQRHAPPSIFEAFVRTRLQGNAGLMGTTKWSQNQANQMLERAFQHL